MTVYGITHGAERRLTKALRTFERTPTSVVVPRRRVADSMAPGDVEFSGCCMVADADGGTTSHAGVAIMNPRNCTGGVGPLAPAEGTNEAILYKLLKPKTTRGSSRLWLPVRDVASDINRRFAYWWVDWRANGGLLIPNVYYTWAVKAILEDFQVYGDDCATWEDYAAMTTADWSEGRIDHEGDAFTGAGYPQYNSRIEYGLASPFADVEVEALVYGFAVEAKEWGPACDFEEVASKLEVCIDEAMLMG
jgi:hypothetical protein